MAETQLLRTYLNFSESYMYTYVSIKSYNITVKEAEFLNEIILKHSDEVYRNDQLVAGVDQIVRYEDIYECYLFMEVCYKTLKNKFSPIRKHKCGFIRIWECPELPDQWMYLVPYCFIDNKKYVPLFYFECTDELKHQAIKLEDWNLAYIKFCCKIQGLYRHFPIDSCLVISLDIIMSQFKPQTKYVDFWPEKMFEVMSIKANGNKSFHIISQSTRITTPSSLEQNIDDDIHHPIPSPLATNSTSLSIAMGINSSQNGTPLNQLVCV